MKKKLVILAILVLAATGYGQKYHPDVQAVRDVIQKWDAGYRTLDPKAMSATIADQYDFVNRFGQWTNHNNREDYEKMWTWAFANVYNGKPGPEHNIEYVRRLTDDVAIVQVLATRKEPVILPYGTKIPPFTQWVMFVVVKQKDEWRIASHNIHNQFPDPRKSEKLPW
ncbi:MAG: SgcJ/EcaC family oxidoreductase [Blastocatellia bacterium]